MVWESIWDMRPWRHSTVFITQNVIENEKIMCCVYLFTSVIPPAPQPPLSYICMYAVNRKPIFCKKKTEFVVGPVTFPLTKYVYFWVALLFPSKFGQQHKQNCQQPWFTFLFRISFGDSHVVVRGLTKHSRWFPCENKTDVRFQQNVICMMWIKSFVNAVMTNNCCAEWWWRKNNFTHRK